MNFFLGMSIDHQPKSSESQVDVSVPVTFVANVEADSVDVLIVVSAVDATDVPITITFEKKSHTFFFDFFSFSFIFHLPLAHVEIAADAPSLYYFA